MHLLVPRTCLDLFWVELNIKMFCGSRFSYTIDIRRCQIVCNYHLGTKESFLCRIAFNKILFLDELNKKCFFCSIMCQIVSMCYLCQGTTEYFLNRFSFQEILCILELNTKIRFFIHTLFSFHISHMYFYEISLNITAQ